MSQQASLGHLNACIYQGWRLQATPCGWQTWNELVQEVGHGEDCIVGVNEVDVAECDQSNPEVAVSKACP